MASTLKINANRLNMDTHSPRTGIIRPELRHFQAAPGQVFIWPGAT